MREWASVAVWATIVLDVAHQPVEEIDVVNRLVHERPAAVEIPGAPPAARIIILLGSPPFDVGIPQGQAAEPATRDRFLQANIGRVNRDGKIVQSRTPAVSQASMIASQRGRVISRGFSTTTCFPARCRLHGRIQVGAAGRADANDVHLGLGEHLLQVVVSLALATGQPGDFLGVRPRRLVGSRPRGRSGSR